MATICVFVLLTTVNHVIDKKFEVFGIFKSMRLTVVKRCISAQICSFDTLIFSDTTFYLSIEITKMLQCLFRYFC